jgi:hypothetical protein
VTASTGRREAAFGLERLQGAKKMKRRWNILVWAGFGAAVVAFVSYFALFIRFGTTRDFPWANLLLFGGAGWLLAAGLKRAFSRPEVYRGKISGPVLGALGLVVFVSFVHVMFIGLRRLPASKGSPQVGQKAPDFTLEDADGKPVTLAGLVSSPAGGSSPQKAGGALLIFYRGYW